MKSAYELAMERLDAEAGETAPALTDEQRERLAEIDRRFKAKIAEREIFLKKQLDDALGKSDETEAEQIRTQLSNERLRLEEEQESAKDKIRTEAT
jgi:hypothetical protein